MLIPKDEYKDTTVSVRTKMGNEKYHLGLISLTNQTIFKYLYDNGFAYIFDIDDSIVSEEVEVELYDLHSTKKTKGCNCKNK